MTQTFQQYNFAAVLTPVRLVSTSNVAGTYFNGTSNNGVGATLTIAASSLTVDSVVAVVSDRILLEAQTNANENGIYVVNSIGSTVVLQRSADQQSIEQYKEGQFVSVGAGSVNGGNAFVLVETLPAILGVSNMTWANNAAVGTVTFSGGASTANALAVFSDTAGNLKAQTVASTLGFGLTLTTGNLTLSSGNLLVSGTITSTAGNVTSGSSGDAGTFISFPATAANGTFIISALNAGGAFDTTLRNGVMGQSTVVTIPDPGAATGNLLIAGAALTSGNVPQFSGTTGRVIDSGLTVATQTSFAQVAMTAAQFNGMYAAPVLLIAAQGANTMIIIESIQLQMTFVSANYAAGGVVAAQYDSTANGAGVICSSVEAAADFQAAASTVFKLNGGVVLAPFTTCANKGIYLSNITGAFTTGDSTFRIKCYYHVISTTA